MDLQVGITAIIALDLALLGSIAYICIRGYRKSFKKPASE